MRLRKKHIAGKWKTCDDQTNDALWRNKQLGNKIKCERFPHKF